MFVGQTAMTTKIQLIRKKQRDVKLKSCFRGLPVTAVQSMNLATSWNYQNIRSLGLAWKIISLKFYFIFALFAISHWVWKFYHFQYKCTSNWCFIIGCNILQIYGWIAWDLTADYFSLLPEKTISTQLR